jgi:hypothetical protein
MCCAFDDLEPAKREREVANRLRAPFPWSDLLPGGEHAQVRRLRYPNIEVGNRRRPRLGGRKLG